MPSGIPVSRANNARGTDDRGDATFGLRQSERSLHRWLARHAPHRQPTREPRAVLSLRRRTAQSPRAGRGRADSRSEAAHVTAYLVDVAGAVEAGGRGHDGRLHGRLGARMSAVSRTHSSEAGQPESWAVGATPLG